MDYSIIKALEETLEELNPGSYEYLPSSGYEAIKILLEKLKG